MASLDDLILNPTSSVLLTPYLEGKLPHALLLHGKAGIGLLTVTLALSESQVIATLTPKNAKNEADPAGTISVEAIRQLYDQTRTKQSTRRVVIIDDADRMSHGAQSAFLKLLEEPAEGISFILTSHHPERLLATIRSRVQAIQLQAVTSDQTTKFIAALGINEQVHRIQLKYIADGLPAELYRLVHDQELFKKRAAIIGDARDFLQAESYQKALIVQRYKTDREAALQLVDGSINILRKTISAKPEERILQQLNGLLRIRESLGRNGNVALQLMQFVI